MRKILLIIAAVLAVALLGGFAFATGGTPAREPASWITERAIAHRGEWTDGPEAPENSLAAFDAAASHGYAVELDVQSSSDGVTVILHDEELETMTGASGLVSDTTLAELQELRLLGGEETIPTLKEALDLIDGRVPVFVEIKNPGDVGELEDDVAAQLTAYSGEACVMSFNPYSLARVAASAPEIPRGQLSSRFEGEDLAWYEKFLLRNLLMNWTSKPDFVAYDLAELPSRTTTLQRLRGRPLLGWTAETQAERTAAEAICDAVICDPEALPVPIPARTGPSASIEPTPSAGTTHSAEPGVRFLGDYAGSYDATVAGVPGAVDITFAIDDTGAIKGNLYRGWGTIDGVTRVYDGAFTGAVYADGYVEITGSITETVIDSAGVKKLAPTTFTVIGTFGSCGFTGVMDAGDTEAIWSAALEAGT
ncbi:MAG: glycerophosphodiester phosphodiesterase family protein [Coriobacteriia bacterium]